MFNACVFVINTFYDHVFVIAWSVCIIVLLSN